MEASLEFPRRFLVNATDKPRLELTLFHSPVIQRGQGLRLQEYLVAGFALVSHPLLNWPLLKLQTTLRCITPSPHDFEHCRRQEPRIHVQETDLLIKCAKFIMNIGGLKAAKYGIQKP